MKKFICLMASLVGLVATTGIQADNFYAGGFGGINWATNARHHHSYKTGYVLGLDAGYKWCNGFRAEVEFSYRNNRVRRSDNSGNSRHANTQLYAGLVNALYEFDALDCWCIKPYVGGGIGYASERRARRGNDEGSHHNKRSGFAWQLIAGVAYPLNDCVDLDLSYRFFKSKEKHDNHALVLGVNYNFY